MDENRYFHALVKEYENTRGDERNWFLIVSGLVTLVVTALGAVALAIQSDNFKCLRSTGKPCGSQLDFLVTSLPIAPLAGLGLIVLSSMQSSIRSRYMRTLESEIRRMIGIKDSDLRPLPKVIERR